MANIYLCCVHAVNTKTLALFVAYMGERVTLRVDSDTKDEWSRAVEDGNEYDSLTHLIQLAVHRELNGMYDVGGGGGSDEGATVEYDPDVSNQELHEEVRRLHRRLGGIEDDVVDVKNTVTTDAVPETRAFFDALPESESAAISAYQMAESMEFTDPDDASEVLERLADETARVKRTEAFDGEVLYYREV